VTSDLIVVTGPSGFCVDETATRAEGDTAFVLLGNCAAISNSRRASQPEVPVVLTAAISEASDGGSIAESLDDLDAYFRSERGLARSSAGHRTQRPWRDRLLVEADQFMIHARDTSTARWKAWRRITGALISTWVPASRPVGLCAGGETVTREDSLNALRAFARSVRVANAGDGVAGVPPQATEAPAPRGGLFNVGLFRRVFN
jgi:hypothetical protein